MKIFKGKVYVDTGKRLDNLDLAVKDIVSDSAPSGIDEALAQKLDNATALSAEVIALLPLGTAVGDVNGYTVDCAIADVPIAFPADLVKASDEKIYKKNSGGTAWEEVGEHKMPTVAVHSLTIPILTESARTVVSLDLGAIGYVTKTLLSFLVNTAVDALYTDYYDGYEDARSLLNAGIYDPVVFGDLSLRKSSSTMLVTENYLNARRFTIPNGSTEKYGAGAGTILPQNLSYEVINVGVLVGWYSLANTGTFGLNKKIEMESAWLERSGSNTLLKIALYNRDVAASTASTIKVAIYY